MTVFWAFAFVITLAWAAKQKFRLWDTQAELVRVARTARHAQNDAASFRSRAERAESEARHAKRELELYRRSFLPTDDQIEQGAW